MRPLLAEMLGAGVVAADREEEAEWKGGGGDPGWDVSADGLLADVKHACHHKHGVLGAPPPPKTGRYDPERVHEIVLVVVESVTTDHE